MSAISKMVTPDGAQYDIRDAAALKAAAAAPAFSSESAYSEGDYVTHDGLLYRATAARVAGAWNSGSGFEQVTVVDLVSVSGVGSSLSGRTYDFSTNAGLYISVRDMVVVLGGSVTNFPTIPNAPSAPAATSSSLSGHTYDFFTNVGLYTAIRDAALALGGAITNFPTIPNT